MKSLVVLGTLLVISILIMGSTEVDYKAKYLEQVRVNVAIDQQLYDLQESSKIKEDDLQNQIALLKQKQNEQYLLRIPMTSIGITDQFADGTLFGGLLSWLIFR